MIRQASRIAAAAALLASASLAVAQENDILIARTELNQLAVGGFDWQHTFVELTFENGALGPGWFTDEPGFDHWTDPPQGLATLLPGSQVWLTAVALDPAVKVYRLEPGPPPQGGLKIIEKPGDKIYLGDESLHKHCIWSVDFDDPGYAPQFVYYGTFVLEDASGQQATSAPFTLHLTYETPCPGDLNADGRVCQADLGELLSTYGLCEGDAGYKPYANIAPGGVAACNGAEGIDQADLGTLLANYGTCGEACP